MIQSTIYYKGISNNDFQLLIKFASNQIDFFDFCDKKENKDLKRASILNNKLLLVESHSGLKETFNIKQ